MKDRDKKTNWLKKKMYNKYVKLKWNVLVKTMKIEEINKYDNSHIYYMTKYLNNRNIRNTIKIKNEAFFNQNKWYWK